MKIRIATKQDAEALLDIYAPYASDTAITFEYEVPSLEEFLLRMQKVQSKYPYLVAEIDGEIVGYAYASTFKERAAYAWNVETSIYIKKNQKRRGIGSALYRALEEILGKQGVTNLNACIAHPEIEDEYLTKDSVRFHEKQGYRLVGEFRQCGYKFNRWYNMVWMEKHIGVHEKNQPKVKSIVEVMKYLDEG